MLIECNLRFYEAHTLNFVQIHHNWSGLYGRMVWMVSSNDAFTTSFIPCLLVSFYSADVCLFECVQIICEYNVCAWPLSKKSINSLCKLQSSTCYNKFYQYEEKKILFSTLILTVFASFLFLLRKNFLFDFHYSGNWCTNNLLLATTNSYCLYANKLRFSTSRLDWYYQLKKICIKCIIFIIIYF